MLFSSDGTDFKSCSSHLFWKIRANWRAAPYRNFSRCKQPVKLHHIVTFSRCKKPGWTAPGYFVGLLCAFILSHLCENGTNPSAECSTAKWQRLSFLQESIAQTFSTFSVPIGQLIKNMNSVREITRIARQTLIGAFQQRKKQLVY